GHLRRPSPLERSASPLRRARPARGPAQSFPFSSCSSHFLLVNRIFTSSKNSILEIIHTEDCGFVGADAGDLLVIIPYFLNSGLGELPREEREVLRLGDIVRELLPVLDDCDGLLPDGDPGLLSSDAGRVALREIRDDMVPEDSFILLELLHLPLNLESLLSDLVHLVSACAKALWNLHLFSFLNSHVPVITEGKEYGMTRPIYGSIFKVLELHRLAQ